MRRRLLVAVVLAAAALVTGVTATRVGDALNPPRLRPAPEAPPVARTPVPAAPAPPFGARVVRRTQLRTRPGGRVVRSVGTTTGYGSPRVLAVVARRGPWLGVLSDHVANSRVAWIPAGSVQLLHEPFRLDVDLSARRIVVRREGRVVRRVRIAIGLPATPTPTGRFAVTDALQIGRGYPQYGCCALALTARQPDVPQGWSGGDRIAIHGTTNERTIGGPASFGCMRARNADMRWLLLHVTLGAQVRIRA
ncbi:MAG: hypothetical protein QOJ35_2458 [Solirubrobacteraceae bacterium]|nr:hypothetical protein [Solirubrobacteraceae bacterium]